MKNLKNIKNILIGFILGLFFIAAYVSAGNGTIGQLFKDLGGGNGWVLIGDNIEDGTIDSSEIEDKTITNKDIAIGTIRTDEILNGTLEEIDFDSNLKNKLNTKSDWNSTSGLSQILNKPTKLSQFTNDKGYQTSTEVDNKISGFATKSYVDNKVWNKLKASQICDENGANCVDISKGIKSYTYSWQTNSWRYCSASPYWGGWGSCTESCGGGTQYRSCYGEWGTKTRDVTCKRSDGASVNDSYCTGVKPSSSQSCTESCYGSSSQSCNTQSCGGSSGTASCPESPFGGDYGCEICDLNGGSASNYSIIGRVLYKSSINAMNAIECYNGESTSNNCRPLMGTIVGPYTAPYVQNCSDY